MRNRHNKKRNTAFLYEVLVRETTKAVVNKDNQRKKAVTKIIRQYFKKGTPLYEELQLYKILLGTTDLTERVSEKLLAEARASRKKINNKQLFNEQTQLIDAINSKLDNSIFSNFIPNYKSLATVSQMFNSFTNIKDKVLLEELILKNLQSNTTQQKDKLEYIDNLVFKTFVEKFNKSYGEVLSEEQKKLVTNYVFSFSDNGVGLKSYLNEEIGRLKERVSQSLDLKEIKSDKDMVEKTQNVLEFLDSLSKKHIVEDDIKKLLKIQILVQEVHNNGD